jgi:cbb3-type cytochrome oxidase subunit 3
MLVFPVLLTLSYFAAVLWFLRSKRRATAAAAAAPCLPDDDQPPASAVGWPPDGTGLTPYVDEGLVALDAYLAGATPPETG